ARMIMHDVLGYSWLLTSAAEHERDYKAAGKTLTDLLPKFVEMGKQRGFATLVVYHPGLSDIGAGDRMKPLLDQTDKSIPAISLVPDFIKAIEARGPQGRWHYFWPEDHHYKPAGYEFMAQLVFEHMRSIGMLPKPE